MSAGIPAISKAQDVPNGESKGNAFQANKMYTDLDGLEDHPLENFRHMKVICIGAGFSGIYMGIRIPEWLRNVDLTIYEKNDGFGGTWWENRYPGIACDIPAHSYVYSFEPKKDWSTFYGSGAEIQRYMEGVARKFSVDRFTKFGHKVIACAWDATRMKWKIEVENLHTHEIIHDESDVLIGARGSLNDFKYPDIDGLWSFKGKLQHSANWDTSHDYSNKRIGVIGIGSSGIQIIPNLQKLEGVKLSCFVRGRTWISASFGETAMEKAGMSSDHLDFSEEEIRRFQEDPKAHHDFRKTIESEINGIHGATLLGSDVSEKGREMFTELMRKRLNGREDILKRILPDFAPGCRRLTPGPGFLEALTKDNVDFISKPIRRITPQGIELQDGTLVELDVIVCATGFNTTKAPPFAIKGANGLTLEERFEPYPEAYMSLAVDAFPNLFLILGPNSAVGSGSLTKIIECTGDYIVKCIRKLQKEGISSMEIKSESVRDFYRYANTYFKKTVYFDDCKSWYRKDDRIVGLWPGSTLHAIEALRSPRWEDWNYKYARDDDEGSVNRLAWLGNGWSSLQTEGGDLSYYIEDDFLDFPSAPFPEETKRWTTLAFSH